MNINTLKHTREDMKEILKPPINYFEPLLKNFEKEYPSEPEYPLAHKELKNIIELTIEGLNHINERLDKMKKEGNLTEEEQKKIEGFQFYSAELMRNNISPISVYTYVKVNTESRENISIKQTYRIDTWYWDRLHRLDYPKLETNNFYDNFRYIVNRYKDREEWLQEYIEDFSIKETHLDLFKKFKENSLLQGDLHFSHSAFKSFLMNNKKIIISERDCNKLKIELDDRNILRNIDLQGNEILICKTPYQIWEEFNQDNHKILQRLITVCRYSYYEKEYDQTKPERIFLLAKAYSLLRMKGLDPSRILSSS